MMVDPKVCEVMAAGAGGTKGVGVVKALETGGHHITNGRNATRLADGKARFPEAEIPQGDIARYC